MFVVAVAPAQVSCGSAHLLFFMTSMHLLACHSHSLPICLNIVSIFCCICDYHSHRDLENRNGWFRWQAGRPGAISMEEHKSNQFERPSLSLLSWTIPIPQWCMCSEFVVHTVILTLFNRHLGNASFCVLPTCLLVIIVVQEYGWDHGCSVRVLMPFLYTSNTSCH